FRVDATRALGHPGVHGVFTAADLAGEPGFGPIPLVVPHPALVSCQQMPLATDEARYAGAAVAAGVAASRVAAGGRGALVGARYEPLRPVADIGRAIASDAARLHDAARGNVAAEFTIGVGDASAAFAAAEIVTRGRYEVQRYTAVPMEPRGVIAAYNA